MLRTALNITLILVIVGVFGMQWLFRNDATQPNYRLPTNMADSVAYDAFSPNPVFADGKTLQAPPGGAIPRGLMPLHYGLGPEEALRAGTVLVSPFADDPGEHLERGASMYTAFCQVCHGPTGLGDGPVTRRGVPPPPSLLADNAMQLSDGHMFHILTYGQNNMASYAAQMSREDRWRVILYMRSLQGIQP
jgi:mono/diheme cytochrome c family protein